MIWQIFILITTIVLSITFGIAYTYEKPKRPYKLSVDTIQIMCYNIIVEVTDKMGVIRHGKVVGNIGDDTIIGFGNDVAPIKDIDSSVKIDKHIYKSYWVVNKDVMYEAYKHRFLNVIKINVNWVFKNL